ncbi:fungal hydrophobin [Agrocybe pediades]|nr:fungal hydrophobin [Agrocybe pediades]
MQLIKLPFALSYIAVAVAATFSPRQGTLGAIPLSQCPPGDVLCCNSVQQADSPSLTTLLGLLGIVIPNVSGLVGLTCDPISVIGVGGGSCSAQPVCCSNHNFNGLLAFGCVPINLNL